MTADAERDADVPDADASKFNHHAPDYHATGHAQFEALRRTCPVARSDEHGGFWIVSRYADVVEGVRDWKRFSSRHDIEPGPDGYLAAGVTTPPAVVQSRPTEIDPPEWNDVRKPLTAFFAPAQIERFRPIIEDLTDDALDRCIESGRMDLVLDLANLVPSALTMLFVGLPLEDWERFSHAFHLAIATPPGPALDVARQAVREIYGRDCRDAIARQMDRPDPTTLIGALLTEGLENIGGPDHDHDAMVSILHNVITGGIDTTSAVLAHMFHHLYEHPEERARLLADRSLVPLAVEEFLRYSTPIQTTFRTVTSDTEFAGTRMSRGDRVMFAYASANRDADEYPDADSVRLDRTPNRHVAFGVGLHRCVGSHLARIDIDIVVRKVLDRIPDYVIDIEGSQPYATVGLINGYFTMPASFEPGRRSAAAPRLLV